KCARKLSAAVAPTEGRHANGGASGYRWRLRQRSRVTPPRAATPTEASCHRRGLRLDTGKGVVDASPGGRGGYPDCRAGLRDLRVVERAAADEDQVWARLGFAEHRGSAGR